MTAAETPDADDLRGSRIVIYSPPKDPDLVRSELQAFERDDERAIVAEVRGQAVDKFFHEISVRGQTQVVISWAGIKWIALREGHMTVESIQLSETPEKYRAIAWAYDKVRDVRMMGASEQSKTMLLKDGSRVPDEFALPKAVSKSQRNALRALIPETLIVEAYRAWKNRDKPPAQPPASTPTKSTAKQPTATSWTDTTAGR
jgi:hypothetical protein